ncbi:MAG: TIGR03084 family protein [Gammaproteobacteria bacterium]|nr:TIGR03084 family protein [Gammaproteobacteria bacterium]
MFQQVEDFRAESDALLSVIEPLNDAEFTQTTLFKGWTFNDVLQHLHVWNRAAQQAAQDPDAFAVMLKELMAGLQQSSMRDLESESVGGITGQRLLDAWRAGYNELCACFADLDPKTRLKWAGPDMSARSSMTARQMETWAHGQAVFDRLGKKRKDRDSIRNIAILGVNTYGWSFKNRGLDAPEPAPSVRLTAPSGATWEWNASANNDSVAGSAVEFCQVVTQTRNVADTALQVVGENAKAWMSFAQCFAGPPENPPAPGSRHIQR